MSDYYLLEGTTVVPAPDVLTWAQAFETTTRRIALTDVAEGIQVSTVFLGMNHQWGEGPPLLFETMVFWRGGGPLDEEQDRYSTYHAAEQGHEAMCARVRDALAALRQEPPHAP